MILLIIFSFFAGIVTILSPCILPLLPVVLAGSVGGGKSRPWGVITGFILSFTFFTLSLSALVSLLGIPGDSLRWFAAIMILLFGLVMVIPALKDRFMALAGSLAPKTKAQLPGQKPKGYWSGFTLGLSLGLVWTPCAGPIMASVITLALSQTVDFGSVILTLSYSLGTSVPLFLIMSGGRSLLTKFPIFTQNASRIQRIFGILMILTSVALMTGFDRQIQSRLLETFPGYGSGLTGLEDQEFIQKALDIRNNSAETQAQ